MNPSNHAVRPAAVATIDGLRKDELHPSVYDPVLDTMNFLNEIPLR